MKYVKLIHTTPMNPVETFEGEFIEEKVARVVENKEPIEDGVPIIYTKRKNGVIPAYNIRTDKWDIALTAMDQVNKNWENKNMETPGTFAEDGNEAFMVLNRIFEPKNGDFNQDEIDNTSLYIVTGKQHQNHRIFGHK